MPATLKCVESSGVFTNRRKLHVDKIPICLHVTMIAAGDLSKKTGRREKLRAFASLLQCWVHWPIPRPMGKLHDTNTS